MQLTLTGEYAVRAMIHLASVPSGTLTQISDISALWGVPENFLRKIVPLLSKSKLIASRRGHGGGIQLGKPAETITLLDVIEAVEGPMYLNKCLIGPEFCVRTRWCAVHCVWSEAQEKLKEILSCKSIAELARLSMGKEKHLRVHHAAPVAASATYPIL